MRMKGIINMKIEYINNDMNKGIKYDYNLIRKELKKYIPQKYYNPINNINESNYQVLISERNVGKTTNAILLGMVMNKLYGTQLQYIRTHSDMITRKATSQLFDTIKENGYIEKLTDGRYNDLDCYAGYWRYCNRDEFGKITEKEENSFMSMLSCDKVDDYKSSYNAPRGDIIIFDEFISMNRYTPRDEFIHFMDIVKTIKRGRLSVKIFMLANTIDKENRYFDELGIYEEIHQLKYGSSILCQNKENSTSVFLAWLKDSEVQDDKTIKEKMIDNLNYFNFRNKKLASIRGGGEWAVKEYPHLSGEILKESEKINCNHYIYYTNFYYRIDVYYNEDLGGFFGYLQRANNPLGKYTDCTIYTLDEIKNQHERYKQGYTDIDKNIFTLFKLNRVYYSTNGVGLAIDKYLQEC